MKKDDIISDEQLSAFTDGELEPEEENRIFTLSEECPELDARLCQQRKLKEMVQHAYREVPEPRRRDKRGGPRRGLFNLAAAAVLALAVGLAGGWMASRALDGGAEATAAVVPASQDTWLLHVASSDPARMQVALNRAEELMNGPGATAHSRVEIVANEGGLDLLRSDRTPFADRIRELAEQDVLFFACNRAIERLQERGVEVHLVPEANTHYSALDRVVHRMQQGWTYEKI
jgi:intracellular sulfur oxidation DsrE/DsrF family protein